MYSLYDLKLAGMYWWLVLVTGQSINLARKADLAEYICMLTKEMCQHAHTTGAWSHRCHCLLKIVQTVSPWGFYYTLCVLRTMVRYRSLKVVLNLHVKVLLTLHCKRYFCIGFILSSMRLITFWSRVTMIWELRAMKAFLHMWRVTAKGTEETLIQVTSWV